MNNSNDKIFLVVLIGLFALVILGSYGMNRGGYGFNGACGMMGGIWCYWPSFGWIIQVLVAIALVLLIIWIVRQLQTQGGKK